MLRAVATVLTAGGAAGQSLFGGGVKPGMTAECPIDNYQTRSTEVEDVCCADPLTCQTGLPEHCDLDCAVVRGPDRSRNNHLIA